MENRTFEDVVDVPDVPDVVLASTNPVKKEGTRRALRKLLGDFQLRCVPAPPDAPDQPLGLDQLFEGARRRAEHASSFGRYGIGVEAGLVFSPSHRGLFLLHVSCIKTREGPTCYGFGPGFQLPPKLQNLLEEGMLLEEAVVQLTGRRELGRATGLVGWMSDGRVVRPDLVEQSVLMALVCMVGRLQHG